MHYKEETTEAYRAEAERHAKRFQDAFAERTRPLVDEFLALVPKGGLILDVGCGPGAHAGYMVRGGWRVEAFDLVPEFVEMAREQGAVAEVGDMEMVEYPLNTFDGIWSYTSLLHLQKQVWPAILKRIWGWLKPEGIFSIAIKEGVGETWEASEKQPEQRRFFSFASADELERLLREAGFDLVREIKRDFHPNGKTIFLMGLCKKAPKI
jgi:SAM-dependent methyltransferase